VNDKFDELKKRFEALEKERQTLLEQRNGIDKKVSEIVVEQLRIDGGLRTLSELKKESAEVATTEGD